jgi:hypothetical protein
MAEKSLVNDVAEMLGVAAADVVLDADDVLVVDELDELPHAASPRTASTARAAIATLLLSNCI